MEPLPPDRPRRGAPEFAALRTALREMADGARAGPHAGDRGGAAPGLPRDRPAGGARDAEPAHPDPPRGGAAGPLRRRPQQREAIEVLVAESDRLEQLAREFTEFGRLPEGPAAPVDLAELLAELGAHVACRPRCTARLVLDPATPALLGHYDPLRRAFSNVLRNAVEACGGAGRDRDHGPPRGRRSPDRDPRPRPRCPAGARRPHLRSVLHREERAAPASGSRWQADGRDARRHASPSSRRREAARPSSSDCAAR